VIFSSNGFFVVIMRYIHFAPAPAADWPWRRGESGHVAAWD